MPSHPGVAASTQSLTTYVFSALRQRIIEHPGPLYRLHIGDTWKEPLAAARAEAQREAEHPGLHRYPPVHGVPALLDAIERKIARRTGVEVPRSAIQVSAGATGGISCTIQALLNPGDEVVILAPFWPLVRGIVASRGGVPVELPFYDLVGTEGFDPEAALEAAVTERTVAIYVNVPSNPTGTVFGPDEIAALARVADRYGLWVLSDEVYEDLWYTDAPPRPLWTYDGLLERTFAVHSMSKGYGLAGARIGYVHGPEEPMRAVRAVMTFQAYSANRPLQVGAARALDEGDAWLAETRGQYHAAAEKVAGVLGVPVPAGGTFLFVDASRWMRPGEADAIPFLHRLLDAGVVFTAGAASGSAYGRYVRVCYTTLPPAELDVALARVEEVLGS